MLDLEQSWARQQLPSEELWPIMRYDTLPELNYPPRFNCAEVLVDNNVAAGFARRPVFYFPGGQWSYAELLARANRISQVLVDEYDLEPGARVLLRGPNNPMLAACWFAVIKAGGIVVCTMPLLRERELRFILGHARISLSITDHRFAQPLVDAAGDSRVLCYGNGELESLAEHKPDSFSNIQTAADDIAIIAYTSGTTGEPKATVHFHRDILAICDCWPKYVLKARSEDVFCGSPPLAFTFGLGGLLLFPLRIGASTLLLEQTAPPQLLEAIHTHRPTVLFTSPTAYRAMLTRIEEFDVSCLRRCVSAGETLPLATFQAWRAATGINIIDGIGATEMLHIFISAADEEIRPGSTGKVVPGYEARVVDENMNEVPRGQIGRLAVRGPTGCRYLTNEERQRAYVRDGWNLTGDAYTMDQDGYFWYQARTDDMIISSGYNISGPEIENVLLEHPAVLECGVVGAAHAERGQIVKAFVVTRTGFEPGDLLCKELQDFVKSQIAPYKYPREIEFVDKLPRTDTGKLQRFMLRAIASQEQV